MIRRLRSNPLFWMIVIIVAATALNLWAQHRTERSAARDAAHVTYENQIEACIQANPAREQTIFVYSTAAIKATNPAVRRANQIAGRAIIAQPFIEANGRKQCYRAIEAP